MPGQTHPGQTPTHKQQRAAALTAARRADSAAKRERTLTAIERLTQAGSRITFARIAREADVSTWLLYNVPEVRAAAEAALAEQSSRGVPAPGPVSRGASAESLRTDLALAREEVKALRTENTRLRDRLRRTLGAEIDQASREELIEQIQRQSDSLRTVTSERDTARAENQFLRPQVQELREQAQAQQDLNRDLMREVNQLKRP
jgi:regulator of replication initiation timing